MKEEWISVKGYENLYEISNFGRVKSLGNKSNHKSEKILKQCLSRKNGYLSVSLSKNGKTKSYRVHRLVAEHFIPNSNKLFQVNHIDGNKQNNHINNLEWITCKENIHHAWNNNLCHISDKHRKSASEKAKRRWAEYRRIKNEI